MLFFAVCSHVLYKHSEFGLKLAMFHDTFLEGVESFKKRCYIKFTTKILILCKRTCISSLTLIIGLT